jgi:hypothetical protein
MVVIKLQFKIASSLAESFCCEIKFGSISEAPRSKKCLIEFMMLLLDYLEKMRASK